MKTEHKAPEMSGIFKEQAENFISFKRSLGFKYQSEEKILSRFCRFSEGYDLPGVCITRKLAEDWTAPRTGEACKSRAHRLTCMRQFGELLDGILNRAATAQSLQIKISIWKSWLLQRARKNSTLFSCI